MIVAEIRSAEILIWYLIQVTHTEASDRAWPGTVERMLPALRQSVLSSGMRTRNWHGAAASRSQYSLLRLFTPSVEV